MIRAPAVEVKERGRVTNDLFLRGVAFLLRDQDFVEFALLFGSTRFVDATDARHWSGRNEPPIG